MRIVHSPSLEVRADRDEEGVGEPDGLSGVVAGDRVALVWAASRRLEVGQPGQVGGAAVDSASRSGMLRIPKRGT